MSVANVNGAQVHGHLGAQHRKAGWDHKSLSRAEVGQEVSVRILSKVTDGRYLAAIGDSRYVVESSLQLTVGQTVKATVSALGGVVELKYLGSGQFELVNADASMDGSQQGNKTVTAVDKLQSKYKIALPSADKKLVEKLSSQAVHPETMTISALYLNKMGASVEDDSLHALYAKQSWSDGGVPSAVKVNALAADVSALVAGVQQGNQPDIAALSKMLGDAVEQLAASTSSSQSPDALAQTLLSGGSELAKFTQQNAGDSALLDDNSLKEIAKRLLNLQDSGTLAYHFGSLPVLIADQLVELDLVLFREREASGRSSGLRKLVMTLKTETLGRVEIVAQSIDSTLSVSIGTQSPDATERLAGHAQEVRDLVARLGWNVDSVAYRLATDPARAAAQLVRHVLNSGTLDAVI